jgi:hypothetical protein
MSASPEPREFTAGHRDGLEQLRRHAAASDGTIEIVTVADTLDPFNQLKVELSLDCEGVPHRDGALRLGPREHVVVLIPAGFPFEYPDVQVPHWRFAGSPHVQWGNRICLYQAPASEWSPSDGMFGLLWRLLQWYKRAAQGELIEPGEPLHPPVVYSPSGTGCVVVRAQAFS